MSDMADFCNAYQDGTMDEYYAYFDGGIDIPEHEQLPQEDALLQIRATTPEDLYAEANAALQQLTRERTTPDCDGSAYVHGRLLDRKALVNLKRDMPTCNACSRLMTPRHGKFGLFYFCGNRCPGQATVSDSYWQKVKAGED